MNYKSIIFTIALISLLIPILTPVLLVLPIATAQVNYTITNIYGTTTFTDTSGATHDNGVYPGDTIIVEVYTPSTATFTVRIVNTYNDSIVYVAQTVKPPEPGYVNVTLTLPKKLPGLTQAIDILEVQLVVAGSVVNWRYLSVLPIIEVTPSVTTIVDSTGTPITVKAIVYGLPEGKSVDEVDIGPYPYYPVDAVADENGMVVIPITLLDLTGEGIPMDVYTVSFIAHYDIPPEYFRNTTLTIKPQVVIIPSSGNGIFTSIPGYDIGNDKIEVLGYGFPANTNVTNIRLSNTNFTAVYYDFPYPLDPEFANMTDEYGYFKVSDLLSIMPTNMTAGLYIPVVYLPDTSYEFRNAYYLVRPILLFLYNGMIYKTYPVVVMPGTAITMVAFGYSPGYDWYDLHNNLTVTLDMVSPLTVVELGRDGNVTFTITIPPETTFGSHYIHGIDSRGYEYSVAIVVGAKAVFVIELKPGTNEVWASYNNTHVEACPCAVYEGKTFCDVCVVYAGACDYVGDYVDVTLYGLQPGETLVKLYLNTTEVPSTLIIGNTTANALGTMVFKFLVPSIPEGAYTIKVVTSVSGEINVAWARSPSINYIVVKPKLLLVTLDSDVTSGSGVLPVLVGSGIVRVIGTGFTPGVSFDTILVNMTDALRTLYTSVRYWSVDSNGIITGGSVEGKDIYPAILFPVLQPGKYEVRLLYYYGTTPNLSDPGYIYVVNNLTYVATKEDVEKLSNEINTGFNNLNTLVSSGFANTQALLQTLDTKLSAKLDTITVNLSTISSKLDSVNKSIGDVASKIGSIGTQLNTVYGLILSQGGKVDTILSLVNDIHTNMTYAMIKLDKIDVIVSKLSDISTSLSTISSSINALSGKLDDVKSAVNSVSSSISDLSSKVAGLDTKITGLDSKMDSGFKGLEAKITSLDSKVDTRFNEVSSKVDSASGAASNSMYIGVIATFFALLAMIFALLGYSTIRKSVVPK
jgi:uncharacterized protein YoxC